MNNSSVSASFLLGMIGNVVANQVMKTLEHVWYILVSCISTRVSFESADVSSKRAMQFVLRNHTASTDWAVSNGVSLPSGYIICRKVMCFAHVTFKVGQPRWGDEHSTDVLIWCPRWISLPAELVVPPTLPPALEGGAVTLKFMKRMNTNHCGWDKVDAEFDIMNCPDAAFEAASSMLLVVQGKKNHGNVFYVNGPTGTGKTTAAMILAHKMNGYFIEYDMTSSGSKFEKLVTDSCPTLEQPLIVSVSEADKKIEQIAGVSGKKLGDKRDVYDKHSLFKLLDAVNFQRKHVVLVMSGNTPFQKLKANLCDPSYTRDTRMTVVNVGGDDTHDRRVDESVDDGPIAPTTPVACSQADMNDSESDDHSNCSNSECSSSDAEQADEDADEHAEADASDK